MAPETARPSPEPGSREKGRGRCPRRHCPPHPRHPGLDAGSTAAPTSWIPDQVRDDEEIGVALVWLLDPLRPQENVIWAVCPQRCHMLPLMRLLIDKLREELPGALRRSEAA